MEEATAALRAAQDQIDDDTERIRQIRKQLFDVQLQLQGLQKAALSGEPIGRTALDTVYDAVIRVCVITLLGGIIGGPALAAATHGLLGDKIVEGVMAGLTAGVSTEAAEAGRRYIRSRQSDASPDPKTEAKDDPFADEDESLDIGGQTLARRAARGRTASPSALF
jgi:hypothetical protein